MFSTEDYYFLYEINYANPFCPKKLVAMCPEVTYAVRLAKLLKCERNLLPSDSRILLEKMGNSLLIF